MGFDRKYGGVTTEHGEIPDDEPVIVFRARDVAMAKLLLTAAYREAERNQAKLKEQED